MKESLSNIVSIADLLAFAIKLIEVPFENLRALDQIKNWTQRNKSNRIDQFYFSIDIKKTSSIK